MACLIASLGASCSKDVTGLSDAESAEGTVEMAVTGQIGELATVELTKSTVHNAPSLMWSQYDHVFVYECGASPKCLGSLSVQSTENGGRIAKLGNSINAPTGDDPTLAFVHVSTNPGSAPEVSSDGSISISLAEQGSETPMVLVGKVEHYDRGASPAPLFVDFEFATSVVSAIVTGLPANNAVTRAEITNLNTRCEINLSGSGAPSVGGATCGTIVKEALPSEALYIIDERGMAVINIAVVETAASATDRKITFTVRPFTD